MNNHFKVFHDLSFKSLSGLLEDVLSAQSIDHFLGAPGILETKNMQENFGNELSLLLGETVSIRANWLNVLKYRGVDNQFPWHSDAQYEGQYVGIYWLMGDDNCGGDLNLRLAEHTHEVAFGSGKLTIFPKSCLHQVTHYFGTSPRISLNFTF